MHIFPLRDDKKEDFYRLFGDYYSELGCDDDCKHLLDEYIIPDLLAGLLRIELLECDGEAAGFVIYQIDDVDNDWNVREGWGDIREIYVVPKFRRGGAGRLLLYTAEMKLAESGVERAYCMPVEAAAAFFTACGYSKTGDYDEELDCFVYEKLNLDNTCHAGAT